MPNISMNTIAVKGKKADVVNWLSIGKIAIQTSSLRGSGEELYASGGCFRKHWPSTNHAKKRIRVSMQELSKQSNNAYRN